ncbi:hypothetical protein OGZ51_01795 [Lactococcus lactis]|uniref:Uncharacterized protein n=1 Tax=Lactococcus lactis TaxID=1358 RepID=A0A9X4S3R3_9LACT|nr:hypothetical protein [Lactococcus lactis]MDG4982883.1 hypothetical protein [Lactococcus lactis]
MAEVRLRVNSLEEAELVVNTLQAVGFSLPVSVYVAFSEKEFRKSTSELSSLDVLIQKEIEKQYQLEELAKAKSLLIKAIEKDFDRRKEEVLKGSY